MSFESDIADAMSKLNLTVTQQARYVSLQILTGVIKKTPVDQGYLRSAWNVGINELKYITKTGQSGRQTIPAQLPDFPTIEITNGLPYAAVVEYGGYPGIGPKTGAGSNPDSGAGIFSKQAPAGMLMLTLQELAANYKGVE